jgi:hypothetical protein
MTKHKNTPKPSTVRENRPPRVPVAGVDRLRVDSRLPRPAGQAEILAAQQAVADLCARGLPSELLTQNRKSEAEVVFRQSADGRRLRCEYSARAMAFLGMDSTLEPFARVADVFAGPTEREDHVVYAEVFADTQNFPPLTLALKRCFGGSFRRTQTSEDRNGRVEGFSFGKSASPLRSKVYRKSITLQNSPRAEWLPGWYAKMPGYQPGLPITRVEFVLRDFKRAGVDDNPEQFLADLPRLWRQWCSTQLFLRKPGNGRPRDWGRVRWWTTVIAAAPFVIMPAPPAPRRRVPDEAHLLAGAVGALAAVAEARFGADKAEAKTLLRAELPGILHDLFANEDRLK